MSTVNLDSIYKAINTSVETTAQNVTNHQVDPNGQKSMIELQQKMQQWTLATQMESNTIKTIAESLKAIISNIR